MRSYLFGPIVFAAIVAALWVASNGQASTIATMQASQQFESSKGWYYSTLVSCAGTEAAVADQPMQVFASNYFQFAVGGTCGGAVPAPKNAQAGDLAVRWILQHAPPNTTNFSKCKDRAWDYNNTATWYMDVTKQFSGLPCGSGFYRAVSKAKYRDGNNVWHHGSQTTGKILK